MAYFVEVLLDCESDGRVEKSPEIVRTDLPLSELLARGEPYAYSIIDSESGDVNDYDPTKDAHPDGPMFANFENIVREISEEERVELFRKIRERDRLHTNTAQIFLGLHSRLL